MSLYYRNIPASRHTEVGVTDEQLLRLWRLGLDTYAIAARVGAGEGFIATRLWQARERAKQEAEWNFDRERA